jgi:hypothetical protein
MKILLQLVEWVNLKALKAMMDNPPAQINFAITPDYVYLTMPDINTQIAIAQNPIGAAMALYDIKSYKLNIERNEIILNLNKK